MKNLLDPSRVLLIAGAAAALALAMSSTSQARPPAESPSARTPKKRSARSPRAGRPTEPTSRRRPRRGSTEFSGRRTSVRGGPSTPDPLRELVASNSADPSIVKLPKLPNMDPSTTVSPGPGTPSATISPPSAPGAEPKYYYAAASDLVSKGGGIHVRLGVKFEGMSSSGLLIRGDRTLPLSVSSPEDVVAKFRCGISVEYRGSGATGATGFQLKTDQSVTTLPLPSNDIVSFETVKNAKDSGSHVDVSLTYPAGTTDAAKQKVVMRVHGCDRTDLVTN